MKANVESMKSLIKLGAELNIVMPYLRGGLSLLEAAIYGRSVTAVKVSIDLGKNKLPVDFLLIDRFGYYCSKKDEYYKESCKMILSRIKILLEFGAIPKYKINNISCNIFETGLRKKFILERRSIHCYHKMTFVLKI